MSRLSPFLRRALLYVPGSSQKMLAKSSRLAVDSVIYDLEDSVTADLKDSARALVANHVAGGSMAPSERGPREIAVRINAIETGLALHDLTHLIKTAGTNLDTLVIPKVQSASDIHFVADVIRQVAPERSISPSATSSGPVSQTQDTQNSRPIHLIGLIESARGLVNLHEICRVGRSLGLVGLAFAAEDFVSDLGLLKLPDRREVLLARSAIVTACRAHEIPSVIDMVSVGVRDETSDFALEEESTEGRSLGFNGKQAIHPSQVQVIQRAFAPSENEISWAAQVFIGDIEAREQGRGAWTLNGKMVDAPVVKAATTLLEKARGCGINLDAPLSKWKK
ncbi:Pyruvate/Phosphoenolpyruvate kinase-like domain-containing protein [Trichoderma evansii]